MSPRPFLRLTAIVIALAGIIDPSMTRALPRRLPLTIVSMDERMLPSAHELARRIGAAGETTVRAHAGVRAAACPSVGDCVLVTDGPVPARLTTGAAVIGALRVPAQSGRILRTIDAAERVYLNAAATLHVRMDRPAKRVQVFDDGVLVGFAAEPQGTEIDVVWAPVAAGPRKLRVVADGDMADVGARVDTAPARTLFFAPEASWSGTFVRRALEDDGRFDVRSRADVASAIAVTSGGQARLDAASLADAEVVVVAAAHALTASQVNLIERFVARRGGSVILVLDRRPVGPLVQLVPRVAEEHHESQPQPVGRLKASGLLQFEESPGVTVLARSAHRAVIVSRVFGRGRVIAVGATDAWRHRDAGRAFESYWAALAWEAATAAGPPLRIMSPPLATPGEDVFVEVAVQSMTDLPTEVTAEGTFECERERGPLRLRPGARPGTFVGVLRPTLEGTCRIAASVAGVAGVSNLLVSSDVRTPGPGDERLNAAMAAYDAVLATGGKEDDLLTRIRERRATDLVPAVTHPMRSPLWILPFAGCLAVEWLLRRRSGLL